MDKDVVALMEHLVGSGPEAVSPLSGGEESMVFRCHYPKAEDLVVIVSADWRTRDELAWAHRVSEHAARCIPEAVAPMRFDDETLFAVDAQRFAAVYPFVHGTPLDTADAELRADAARVLAQMHRAMLDWTGGPRPAHGPSVPLHKRIDADADRALARLDPPELEDAGLDQWWEEARLRLGVATPSQGDFWSANILCAGKRVEGVVDWHDARVIPCASELGWAAWSCTGGDVGAAFDRFVEAYREAGGPVGPDEVTDLIPLLRVRLRDLIRRTVAMGCPYDHPYMRGLVEPYNDLRQA